MKEWQKWIVVVIEIALLVGAVWGCIWAFRTVGLAEEQMDCWVICQPTDYVNVRRRPGRRSEIVGRAEAGMRFQTDGKEKSGFIHVIGVGEYGEGWISSGYVSWSRPEDMDREMEISSRGRVACRKCIGGKRRCWALDGEKVRVYWMADGWAVTSRGFIQSQYLEGAK